MSPASSGGTLEVEKYIGACLISSTRPKNREVYYNQHQQYNRNYVNYHHQQQRCNNDRWAGGMPLISFANHQRRRNEGEQQLNRLAGAPLIVTKTYNRRNKNQQKNAIKQYPNKTKCGTDQNSVDTVSVTSDESSGSQNSDHCLPRIIKPRKRRKKDRKPNLRQTTDDFSTDSASPDIDSSVLSSYIPFVFESSYHQIVPPRLPLIAPKWSSKENVEETPKLHHCFEDVEELDDKFDINGNQATTVCQCRYCDPSGQIWDVDRDCYSPFLTNPVGKSSSGESLLPRRRFGSLDHNCLVYSMSSISLNDGVGRKRIEDRVVPLSSSSGDLEVSTEIVTSLNGHRDIEIKFFSTSAGDNNVRALLNGGKTVNGAAGSSTKCVKEVTCDAFHVNSRNKCALIAEE